MGRAILQFWLDDKHREARTWTDHREINMVMLATALAPGDYSRYDRTASGPCGSIFYIPGSQYRSADEGRGERKGEDRPCDGEGLHEAVSMQRRRTGSSVLGLQPPLQNQGRGPRDLRSPDQPGGTLYAATYAKISSEAVDPIEKKPLFHFLPGSLSYSLGSVGCNFRCEHCQNWHISQAYAG